VPTSHDALVNNMAHAPSQPGNNGNNGLGLMLGSGTESRVLLVNRLLHRKEHWLDRSYA